MSEYFNNKKRERGANYTPEEKAMFAELISEYKDIVEDQGTGGLILYKKREAWKEITMRYNSECTTGPRKIGQLKALHDNMKQKSRKSNGDRSDSVFNLDSDKMSQGPVRKFRTPLTTASMQHMYFKKKFQNACLEQRKLTQEILHAKQQHDLKMMILHKELEKLNHIINF